MAPQLLRAQTTLPTDLHFQYRPTARVIRRKLTQDDLIIDCAGAPIGSDAIRRSATEGPCYRPTEAPAQTTTRPGKVPGLAGFLCSLGLAKHEDGAEEWCQKSGAAFLEEVYENRSELADELQLSEEERGRLLEAPLEQFTAEVSEESQNPARHATVQQAPLARGVTVIGTSGPRVVQSVGQAISIGLGRTWTGPVTVVEQGAAETCAAKAVPLTMWQSVAAHNSQAFDPSLLPSWIQSTTWYSQGSHLKPLEDFKLEEHDVQSRRQKIRSSGHFYRMRAWTPPRSRITRPEDWKAIRARIPSPAELNAVSDAQQRLAEGPAPTAPAAPGAAAPLNESETFREMQDGFMRQYGKEIRQELPGVKLTPAPLAHHVQKQFMKSLDQGVTVQAAYHGTREQNFAPILQKGLRVPGGSSGVAVAHGSAHGVGIYTAKLGNAGLSRGFCDSDSFLVCAVADDATKPKGTESGSQSFQSQQTQTVKWTGSGPSGSKHHRVTQKASTQGQSASKVTMIGNHQLYQETNNVRHVGSAMVVFDEARVAPLFVAKNIGHCSGRNGRPVQTVWGMSGNPNSQGAMPGGGFQVGRGQLQVGDERFWAPAEELTWKQGTELRRRIETKQRDVMRRARRDAKASGEAARM